jgi:hypothetical protein
MARLPNVARRLPGSLADGLPATVVTDSRRNRSRATPHAPRCGVFLPNLEARRPAVAPRTADRSDVRVWPQLTLIVASDNPTVAGSKPGPAISHCRVQAGHLLRRRAAHGAWRSRGCHVGSLRAVRDPSLSSSASLRDRMDVRDLPGTSTQQALCSAVYRASNCSRRLPAPASSCRRRSRRGRRTCIVRVRR